MENVWKALLNRHSPECLLTHLLSVCVWVWLQSGNLKSDCKTYFWLMQMCFPTTIDSILNQSREKMYSLNSCSWHNQLNSSSIHAYMARIYQRYIWHFRSIIIWHLTHEQKWPWGSLTSIAQRKNTTFTLFANFWFYGAQSGSQHCIWNIAFSSVDLQ